MNIFKLNGINVLGGLDWVSLDPELPYKKALADFYSKNKNIRSGILLQANGEGVIGFVPSSSDKKIKTKGIPSAEALLSMANQRQIENMNQNGEVTSPDMGWILVQKIDNETDKYWVGIVRNGLPLPGGDFVGNYTEINEKIEEILNFGAASFTLYTKEENIHYNFMGAVSVVEKSFSEIIIGLPREKAHIKIFSFAGILAVSIFALMIVVVGSWWGISEWQQKVQMEKMQKEAKLKSEQQEKQAQQISDQYEKTIKDLLSKSLDQGMAEISSSLTSSSGKDVLLNWQNIIYNLSVFQGTWDLNEIDCGLENQIPLCTVNLVRGDIGNNRELLKFHPDAIIVGDKASYVIRGPELNVRQIDFQNLANAKNFGTGFLSNIQFLSQSDLKHEIEASKNIVKEVVLPPLPTVLPKSMQTVINDVSKKPPEKVSIDLGYASGHITISGDGLWQFSGLSDYINEPNLKIETLMVKIDPNNLDSTLWDLKGTYIIRVASKPMVPEIPFGDKKIKIDIPDKYQIQTDEDLSGIETSKVDTMDTLEAPSEQKNLDNAENKN